MGDQRKGLATNVTGKRLESYGSVTACKISGVNISGGDSENSSEVSSLPDFGHCGGCVNV